jgi:hypothetical protein
VKLLWKKLIECAIMFPLATRVPSGFGVACFGAHRTMSAMRKGFSAVNSSANAPISNVGA